MTKNTIKSRGDMSVILYGVPSPEDDKGPYTWPPGVHPDRTDGTGPDDMDPDRIRDILKREGQRIQGEQMLRKEVIEHGSRVKEIVYQPGNGTRYDIILTDIDDNWVFSWPIKGRGGVSMLLRKGAAFLHYDYMKEKMPSLGMADVAALLVLVMEETGRPVAIPPEYNEKGLWEEGAPGGLIDAEHQP